MEDSSNSEVLSLMPADRVQCVQTDILTQLEKFDKEVLNVSFLESYKICEKVRDEILNFEDENCQSEFFNISRRIFIASELFFEICSIYECAVNNEFTKIISDIIQLEKFKVIARNIRKKNQLVIKREKYFAKEAHDKLPKKSNDLEKSKDTENNNDKSQEAPVLKPVEDFELNSGRLKPTEEQHDSYVDGMNNVKEIETEVISRLQRTTAVSGGHLADVVENSMRNESLGVEIQCRAEADTDSSRLLNISTAIPKKTVSLPKTIADISLGEPDVIQKDKYDDEINEILQILEGYSSSAPVAEITQPNTVADTSTEKIEALIPVEIIEKRLEPAKDIPKIKTKTPVTLKGKIESQKEKAVSAKDAEEKSLALLAERDLAEADLREKITIENITHDLNAKEVEQALIALSEDFFIENVGEMSMRKQMNAQKVLSETSIKEKENLAREVDERPKTSFKNFEEEKIEALEKGKDDRIESERDVAIEKEEEIIANVMERIIQAIEREIKFMEDVQKTAEVPEELEPEILGEKRIQPMEETNEWILPEVETIKITKKKHLIIDENTYIPDYAAKALQMNRNIIIERVQVYEGPPEILRAFSVPHLMTTPSFRKSIFSDTRCDKLNELYVRNLKIEKKPAESTIWPKRPVIDLRRTSNIQKKKISKKSHLDLIEDVGSRIPHASGLEKSVLADVPWNETQLQDLETSALKIIPKGSLLRPFQSLISSEIQTSEYVMTRKTHPEIFAETPHKENLSDVPMDRITASLSKPSEVLGEKKQIRNLESTTSEIQPKETLVDIRQGPMSVLQPHEGDIFNKTGVDNMEMVDADILLRESMIGVPVNRLVTPPVRPLEPMQMERINSVPEQSAPRVQQLQGKSLGSPKSPPWFLTTRKNPPSEKYREFDYVLRKLEEYWALFESQGIEKCMTLKEFFEFEEDDNIANYLTVLRIVDKLSIQRKVVLEYKSPNVFVFPYEVPYVSEKQLQLKGERYLM